MTSDNKLTSGIITRLIAAFFWFAGIDIIILGRAGTNAISMWQDFITGVPVIWLVARTVIGFAFLTLITFLMRKNKHAGISDNIALLTGTVFYACISLWKSENFYVMAGVLAVCLVLAAYAVSRIDSDVFTKLSSRSSIIIIAVLAAIVLAVISVAAVFKHMTYNTMCYDMGIFNQMFHSMRTNLTAVTTCERDYSLSHFRVHASYILYVLLPFYAIVPSGNTLIIAQAVLVISGVIPAVLIARKRDYKGLHLVFVAVIYLLNCGLVSPCFFHFHENCFLAPILMWLLYAADTRRTVLIYILSVMTLLVKEDAALYVIFIGLFLLFDEKSRKRVHGGIITVISLVYFVLILNWMTANGSAEMMMDQRFSNLMFGENSGVGSVVMNILRNPTYFFGLLLSKESIVFFLEMMIPLLFMPFMTTRIHRYLLMLPFVIINLVIGSGYRYSAEMGYHYTFGTAALLIFMAIINCSELKDKTRSILITVAACATVITAVPVISSNLTFIEQYMANPAIYQKTASCLAMIPKDATVISDTNHLPHLTDRNELYLLSEDDYVTTAGRVLSINDIRKYDYFVMDPQDGNTQGAVGILESSGFTRFAECEGSVVIYKKN